MKNQNENAAVSDVTARMREEASILSLLNGQSVGVASVVNKLREFADSIDAAVSKTETTTPGNAAAMREALVKLQSRFQRNVEAYYDRYLKFTGWHWTKKAAEAKKWCDIFSELNDKCKAAIAEPPRNCDLFGGDYKMLHTAWFDWTGSPSGQNPDGTAKMGFGEWLLALAGKRGAV